jgi:hypothetical protein
MAKNGSKRRYYPAPRIRIDRGLAWYCVATRSRAESDAQDDLDRAGFSTYLPTESVKVRRRGKLVSIERVPVSGYLFVGLNAAQPDFAGCEIALGWTPSAWLQSERPRGRLLHVNHEPLRVHSGQLERYANVCAGNGSGAGASGRLQFRHGDKVRYVGGLVDGLVMSVADYLCSDRIRCIAERSGGRVVVEAKVEQLEAA